MLKEVLIKELRFSGTLGVIVDMTGSKTLNFKYRMLLLCCRLLEMLLVGLVTLARCCIPDLVMISCFFLRSVGPTAVCLCCVLGSPCVLNLKDYMATISSAFQVQTLK